MGQFNHEDLRNETSPLSISHWGKYRGTTAENQTKLLSETKFESKNLSTTLNTMNITSYGEHHSS